MGSILASGRCSPPAPVAPGAASSPSLLGPLLCRGSAALGSPPPPCCFQRCGQVLSEYFLSATGGVRARCRAEALERISVWLWDRSCAWHGPFPGTPGQRSFRPFAACLGGGGFRLQGGGSAAAYQTKPAALEVEARRLHSRKVLNNAHWGPEGQAMGPFLGTASKCPPGERGRRAPARTQESCSGWARLNVKAGLAARHGG